MNPAHSKDIRVLKSLGWILLILVLIVTICFCAKIRREERLKPGAKWVAKGKPTPSTCPVCGVETTSGAADRRPIAIMIENLVSIRPQIGLDKACVIFEALTEGGITRLLAVYVHEDAEEIGPVRSARPYYVALARGFNAIYAHCGGSKRGMEAIKQWGICDLDQFAYPKAYWRVRGIKAPHNLFTSTSRIRETAERVGFAKGVGYRGFKFKSEAPLKNHPQSQNIVINFSSQAYKVEYHYHKDSNSYLRFNGGRSHIDRETKNQLQPKNVVILYCPTGMYDPQCLNIQIIGSGSCLVFRDGTVVRGTWEKAEPGTQLVIEDEQGVEIPLNRGQTWVEIVKPDTPVGVRPPQAS